MWIFAGALLGWAGWKYFGLNEERGAGVSALIGAAGGIIGGKLVAPMVVTSAVASEISTPALFIAAGVAAGFLVVGNLVLQRWGV